MASKRAKAKPVTGWRWQQSQEATLSFWGYDGFYVVIERQVRADRTVYVAMSIDNAADDLTDDRVVELGAFDVYLVADKACEEYIARRTGEPMPDWEPFDPTAGDPR